MFFFIKEFFWSCWKFYLKYYTPKLEGLGGASLATKPLYANFLRKDMVTFEGFLGTLTVPKNFDHLNCVYTRPTRGKVPACSKKIAVLSQWASSTNNPIIELTVIFSSRILGSMEEFGRGKNTASDENLR